MPGHVADHRGYPSRGLGCGVCFPRGIFMGPIKESQGLSRTDVGFQAILRGSLENLYRAENLLNQNRNLIFPEPTLGQTIRSKMDAGFQVGRQGAEKRDVGPKGLSSRTTPQYCRADTWKKLVRSNIDVRCQVIRPVAGKRAVGPKGLPSKSKPFYSEQMMAIGS